MARLRTKPCLREKGKMQERIEEERMSELTEGIILNYLVRKKLSKDSIVCVDIEGLAREYFKQTIIFENIAEDDPGKDGFSGNGIKPIKLRRNGRIEEVVIPKDTIVLDRYLLNHVYSNRRRLVIAHELGHRIYDKIAPGHDAGNYHTIFDCERLYSYDELHDQMSVPENQATSVGCDLLMPPFLVRNTVRRVTGNETVPVYGLNQILPDDSINIKKIADDLGVTYNMLMIRLRQLKLFDYHSFREYFAIVGLEGK